ncbi:MAG: SDR family NAD(P)-dependent oxidoreductase [Chloroflexi bacterium]|nr:SDR family NAD(P)-dependent oxidoreductase [Chloroflexota bacterium]OJV91062.1 MAG: NAD-dependent epimerase [Chloroflexi bacterium 54-19]
MANSRILVTGGAGFVGSHIVDALLAEGAAEVIAIDNMVRGNYQNIQKASQNKNFRFVEGDIRDQALVNDLVEGCDYVFHEAALRITACAADPRTAHEVMFTGTFNVLEAAVKHQVKKVVAASSASVYGQPSYSPIDENHPFNNRTLYGAAKVANEQVLRSFNDMYGLPYVALRYFNLYGPRMDMTGVYTEVMVRWMDRLDQGLPPLIFGDGKTSMDFVYIGDCVRANLAALKSDISDEVFNVATGVETSLNELCQIMLEQFGRTDLQPEYREERKINPVTRRLGGTEKARTQLGFESKYDLAEGLRLLLEWRQEQKSATLGV